MLKTERNIRIEYPSGLLSPYIVIEIFVTTSDIEIQFKEVMKKGNHVFPMSGIFAIAPTTEEAWEIFKRLVAQKIKGQDPEKIYIV